MCTGAVAEISSRMVCRFSGRKISRSPRLVSKRVFVGGVGCVSGGKLERSSLREDALLILEDAGREGREVGDPDMVVCCVYCFAWVAKEGSSTSPVLTW